MLTELQRKRVWEAWFGGEVRANYFADLAGRYYRRHQLATWLTLFLSSGAFLGFLALRPKGYEWVPILLTALTAAVSLYSIVMQNQQRGVDCADLQHRWSRLSSDYRNLWDSMNVEDSPARLASLDERAADLSKVGTRFPVKPKLIRKWHEHVAAYHKAA